MKDRFVARNSTLRLTLLLIGSFAFVVAGLWVAGLFGSPPRPGRQWLGWLTVMFFAYTALMGIRRLLSDEDWLEIDEQGVRYLQHSKLKIPWSAVRSHRRVSVRRQQFISLELVDPARFPRTGGTPFAGVNKLMGFGDIVLSTVGTDRSFEELAEAVDRFAPPGR